MGKYIISISFFAVLLLHGSVQAIAANKRVALIVANAAYKLGDRLANPLNDSTLVSEALKRVQFDVIELQSDLGIAQFRQALRQFRRHSDGAEVALIYFAGHGVEVDGVNWLVPTDAELRETRDLEYEAIKLDLALQALSGARIRVIALDACRNNPFSAAWRATSRTLTRGLGRQEADGVLVLFAAAPGQIASDGRGANSPFAAALAKRLPEEGLAIQLLGGRVRDDVLAATGDTQRAFVSASITGEPYYLVPAKQAPARDREIELMFWSSVKDSTSASVLRTYLDRYPHGEFAAIANALVAHYEEQAKLNLAAREEEAKRQEESRQQAEIKRLELERRIREAALAEERIQAKKAKDLFEVKRIEEQERHEHAARQQELLKAQQQARLAKEAAEAAGQQRVAAARSAQQAAKAAEAEIEAKRKVARAQDDTTKLAALSLPKPSASKGYCNVDPFGRKTGTGAATGEGANATMTASHGTDCGFRNWMDTVRTIKPDVLDVSHQPRNGTVKIVGNRVIYRAREGYLGTDSFVVSGHGRLRSGERRPFTVRMTVTVVD